MAQVQFKKGLYSAYKALATKDANTLYFCTDTQQVFLGESQYSYPVTTGAYPPTTTNNPPAKTPNALFYDSADKELYICVGDSWTKITHKDLVSHIQNTDIHVTTADKTKWNGKQDALSEDQLAAANSGATAAKISGYDTHVADDDIHVTTNDKEKWNSAQANAEATAAAALSSAKSELEGKIKSAQDKADAAWQDALANAGKISTLETTTIPGITSRLDTAEDEIDALQNQIGGLTGAMHFRGTVTADPTKTAPTLTPAAASGDVVLWDGKEYIYDGSAWVLFGDEGSYLTKTAAAETYETKSDSNLVRGRVQAIEDSDVYKSGIDSEQVATFNGHVASKSNPHEVTAAQVGAYTTAQVDSKLAEINGALGNMYTMSQTDSAIDEGVAEANAYTDEKVADVVAGALTWGSF